MELTKKEVLHIANLARLSFSDEEIEKFTKDLISIVHFADKLNELDTTDIEPTAHTLPIQNVFRKDEARPSFDRDKMLQNAPTKDAGCYSVPKVVE